MHWDPEYSDVKLIQTMMFVSEVKNILEKASSRPGSPTADPNSIPLVLCADLNSLPDSGIYNIISSLLSILLLLLGKGQLTPNFWVENVSSKLGSVSVRILGMGHRVIEESLVKKLFWKVPSRGKGHKTLPLGELGTLYHSCISREKWWKLLSELQKVVVRRRWPCNRSDGFELSDVINPRQANKKGARRIYIPTSLFSCLLICQCCLFTKSTYKLRREGFAADASKGQPPVSQSAVEKGSEEREPENIQHR